MEERVTYLTEEETHCRGALIGVGVVFGTLKACWVKS